MFIMFFFHPDLSLNLHHVKCKELIIVCAIKEDLLVIADIN